MGTYEWITNRNLTLDGFYTFVDPVPTEYPDQTGYYSTRMQFKDFGVHHLWDLDLGISARRAQIGEIFTLCNMTTWAEHYDLPSAWCFVLTTATALLENPRWGTVLRPDHKKLEKVLHPLVVGTTWDSTPHAESMHRILKKHFRLSNSRNENPAFSALGESKDLHLSSLAFYLTTLMHHTEPDYTY